jgi:uncharacterized protein YndB with AHSA1/START domain
MPTPESETVESTVYEEVEIAAPPEEVFRALTDPRELEEWWGSGDGYRTREWEVDARPGGEWRVRTTDGEGNEATVEGEYLVVDPPRRLEYTWRTSRDGFAPTRVRYDLAPAEVDGVDGTRVTVTHTGSIRSSEYAAPVAFGGSASSIRRLVDHLMACASAAGPSGGWRP